MNRLSRLLLCMFILVIAVSNTSTASPDCPQGLNEAIAQCRDSCSPCAYTPVFPLLKRYDGCYYLSDCYCWC
jgi:hypothetical protein